ncbi:uncharacterized protein [Salvelinus sp. IW2-2015]|uniref:uncharacterized protein isoform X2 n=1 Tax=Salvelinus sp. IW2-2015 TaxID=2691554 RepID=UPI000CEAFC18|nr:uncharacterized protein LOC112077214 isoform X1 [Salvelinus alpinus]
MVKRYDPEGAVGNTVNILRKMNQHDLTKLQRDHRERPLEVDCPPILESPLEVDCPPILERPLEIDCPPILESPLEVDCPPILESPLEVDCPPILESPLEMDCPPVLETPLEMANSLNTEVSVNTQENTQRMDEELGRERDSPLLLDHHHMSSPDEFTPEIHDQDNRGEYRFQCPRAGLFQCSITGLVFRMEGEGEVLYRTVPWDRSLLAQKGKRPAGPLFNIDCPQKSVSQLHLPHCEILSEGGCDFLSVAHVTDDIEFIPPLETTEKHIIINITGFSAYGEVKDDNAPITSINAHVLLFYLPQPVPRRKATLNVLLLPSNVVIREVKEKMEHLSDSKVIYIITPSECELIPQQQYSLSTDLVQTGLVIQPKIKRFVDNHSSENYVPAFQVLLQYDTMEVNLFLRKENPGSTSTVREDNVWENLVLLPATPPADDSAVSPTEVPSSVTPPGGVTAASKLHEPAAPPMDISTHPPQTSTLPTTSMVIQSLLVVNMNI